MTVCVGPFCSMTMRPKKSETASTKTNRMLKTALQKWTPAQIVHFCPDIQQKFVIHDIGAARSYPKALH